MHEVKLSKLRQMSITTVEKNAKILFFHQVIDFELATLAN